MTVNTKGNAKAAATPKAATVATVATVAPAPTAVQKILLTLGLYQRYSDAGVLYEKNKVYAFDFETGTNKLQEEDNGRPIWRVYKEVKTEDATADNKPVIVDMTAARAPANLGASSLTAKGLEIGSDDELAELGLGGSDATGSAAPAAGVEVGSVDNTEGKGDTSGAVSV